MKYIVTMEMKEDIEPFMPYRQKKIKYTKNSTKNKSTKNGTPGNYFVGAEVFPDNIFR